MNLKSEMDILKIEEKQTQLDRLHEESIQRGDTKYQTLQKVKICYTESVIFISTDIYLPLHWFMHRRAYAVLYTTIDHPVLVQ